MSRLVAMISLWPVEDGFVTQVWRLVDGAAFSPTKVMQAVPFAQPGEVGRLLLAFLDHSARLSAEPYSSVAADADFLPTRQLRPTLAGVEIVLDRDDEGSLVAWRQVYDDSVNESRQAVVPVEGPEPEAVEQAIIALLRGAGGIPGDPGDLEFLRRQLELMSSGDYSGAETADAFTAAANRFGGHPIATDLTRAAEWLRAQPEGEQRQQLLNLLWNWLDGYDLNQPRSLQP